MRIYTNIMGMRTNQTKPTSAKESSFLWNVSFHSLPFSFAMSLYWNNKWAQTHTHRERDTRAQNFTFVCVFLFLIVCYVNERAKLNTRRRKNKMCLPFVAKTIIERIERDTIQTPKDHVHIENYSEFFVSFVYFLCLHSFSFFILLKSKHKIIQKHKWGKTRLYCLRSNGMGCVFVVQWNIVKWRCVLDRGTMWPARKDNKIRNEKRKPPLENGIC